MAGVSSKVSNFQCKQSLVAGWHSEGSGGPSLQVQHKKQNQTLRNAAGSSPDIFTKGRLKKPLCTVAYTQRLEGRTGLNCVGGVNEVQRSAKDPRQHIGQLLPCAVHTKRGRKKQLYSKL